VSDNEIRIAIAEACGWRRQISESAILGIIATQWFKPDGTKAHSHEVSGNALGYIPDYLNNLNAIHVAECLLVQQDKWVLYLNTLREVICADADEPVNSDAETVYQMVTAMPGQRAEAFLRTLGKWKHPQI
jgi:hypothetical protein